MVKFRLLIALSILLSYALQSCSSCSREETDEVKFDDPAWVAEQFFKAYLDQKYEKAASYCDKQSKRTLEYVSQYAVKKEQKFIAVDSCEEFSDYANCYCRYQNEEAEEKTEKVLLRDFNKVWKVHFDKGGSPVESSPLLNNQAELNPNAPDQLNYLTDHQVEDANAFFQEFLSYLNHQDLVVGFAPKEVIEESFEDVYSTGTTSNTINIYNEKYSFDATFTFNFDYDQILTSFEVDLSKLSLAHYEYYAYFLQQLIEEFGQPANASGIDHADLYYYSDLVFYYRSYNQKLTVDCNDSRIIFTVTEAL